MYNVFRFSLSTSTLNAEWLIGGIMLATQLEYGKFQTSIFKLAQELGNGGADIISRLDTDQEFRKRVAKHMQMGAPSPVYVTTDEHKSKFVAAIEKLERAKNLTPEQVGDLIAEEKRAANDDYRRRGLPLVQPGQSLLGKHGYMEREIENSRRDYIEATRGWCTFACSFLGGGDGYKIKTQAAHVLGTTVEFLERISERFESPVKIELDPQQSLGDIPENIQTIGQLLLWLSSQTRKGY